ncbi:hypothetical protein [Streptomyces ziwulingensis]|uniref:Secreted protein n=1 Tax=Streptomyces ziwulingensis TaxID=1045501 RepID=A0ABP9C3E3_9ACTN
MIKKLATATATASALAVAFLTVTPAAHAAPLPEPSAGIPGGRFLEGLLGALEIGHPASSAQSLLPAGVRSK